MLAAGIIFLGMLVIVLGWYSPLGSKFGLFRGQ